MEIKEPTSFLRLLEKYIEEFKDEEELKPFLEPTSFPRYSEFLKFDPNKISEEKSIKFAELTKVWTVISIVHYIDDFTLDNANLVLKTLEDDLFIVSTPSIDYDFKIERKPATYSVIADMDSNITMKLTEAVNKDTPDELVGWILLAERIRKRWVKFNMKNTVQLGLLFYLQKFGQKSDLDRKLLVLALKFLGNSPEYKLFLEQEAIKYLEIHIKDRMTSKEIIRLFSRKSSNLDKQTKEKIEKFEKEIGLGIFSARKEIRRNYRNVKKLFKPERTKGFELLKSGDIEEDKPIKRIVNLKAKSHVYMGKMKRDIKKVADKENNTIERDNENVTFKENNSIEKNYKNVAVKVYINIEKTDDARINLVCKEAANAIFLSKKDNIFIKFYGLYLDFDLNSSTFEFGIVMERCDMDLSDALKQKSFSESECFDKKIEYYIDTLLNGFKLLHDLGIAHRDIKPQNIFLKKSKFGEDLKIKIADYNVSSLISKASAILSDQGLAIPMGQESRMAPEFFRESEDNHLPKTIIINKQKADVYSLGLVFLELHMNLYIESHSELKRNYDPFPTGSKEEWMAETGWNYINNEIKANWIKELLTSMLDKDPNKRKRLSELVRKSS